jgi:hypothetical protein
MVWRLLTHPAMACISIRRGARWGVFGAFCLAGGALATPTDPTLALTGAGFAGGAIHRVVRVDGSFQAQDLVQLAYPLQVLVHAGASYVRYDLSAGAFTGTAAELADGLQAGEAPGLLTKGTAAADAQVLFLGLGRLEVSLPATFPAGPAAVQMFVIDEGETVLSNAVPVSIGAAP